MPYSVPLGVVSQLLAANQDNNFSSGLLTQVHAPQQAALLGQVPSHDCCSGLYEMGHWRVTRSVVRLGS